MNLKIIILTLLALTFVSCSPKFNPSKEYGEPQKVNLKDFEGKWEMINNYSNIVYSYIDIRISNDTIFKYTSSKYTNNESFEESFDTLKFEIKEDRIINKYNKLIPFLFIYFFQHNEKNEYTLTDKDILVERHYLNKFGMILIIFPAGMTVDNYHYYKRVE